jgi:hypothetical protein
MGKVSLYSKLLNISDLTFFILLFIYQLIFLFQGFDFADEGAHSAFYQQIFSHPETMMGDFMYWFSGIFGGIFYYFFADFGLLGLRFQGLFTILVTTLIAYYLLKNYINILHLRIGTLIIFALTTNEIKEMHYDTLTALLNISSALFLFQGIKDNKLIKITLSGALISLSMFTRLPSIVMLAFVLAIIYFGIINKSRITDLIRQGLSLIGGFFLMTILVLLFMKLIGHLPVYIEALKMVFSWGTSSEDSHSIFRLIKRFVIDYSDAVKFGMYIIVILIMLKFTSDLLDRMDKASSRKIMNLIKLGIILAFVALILKHKINHARVISIFTGLSLIVSACMLLSTKISKELKLLVFIGCLIVFFEPLGSAGGISTSGKHSLWIIFPIAIDFVFSIKKISSHSKFSSNNTEFSLPIQIEPDQLEVFKSYFVGLSLAAVIYFSYYYPYFDMSDRIYMTYSIDNKNARGIYTTKERAAAVNELLSESAKYVKKNDFVLAYDCMPMFHYLTETLPYTPNTWPWLYVPEAFKSALDHEKNNSAKLPVVIVQKMSTLGTNWPQNLPDETKRALPELQRDSIMAEFINNNHYKSVWENVAFRIYLPEEKIIK